LGFAEVGSLKDLVSGKMLGGKVGDMDALVVSGG
jgi:hypothetical protein